MKNNISISERLTNKKLTITQPSLQNLKSNINAGILAKEDTRKKNEALLKKLLKGSLFLRNHEKKKKRWLDVIPKLPIDLLNALIDSTIRENLRYKTGKRDIIKELLIQQKTSQQNI